jgi:hypothetical protein
MVGGDAFERELVEVFGLEHPPSWHGKTLSPEPRQPRRFTTHESRMIGGSLAPVRLEGT